MTLIVVFVAATVLAACGSGGSEDAYGERDPLGVAGNAVTVELTNLQFAPQGIRIKAGTTVTWVNNDAAVHNVRQIDSVFLSQDVMPRGDTFSYTFDAPGTFRYQCTFHHPNMNGVVIVADS
ncbi:MAG: plastocyanin/azurin family copper-binding protein [Dehalococcoidia bacterium]